jgi:hypothetical protein
MLLIGEKRQSKREAIDRISQVYLVDVPRPLPFATAPRWSCSIMASINQ